MCILVVVAMLIVPARVATRMTYFPAIVLTGVPVRDITVVAVVGITVTVTAMRLALVIAGASTVTLGLNIVMSLVVVTLALIPMAIGLAGMGRRFSEGRCGHDECQSGDCELEHVLSPTTALVVPRVADQAGKLYAPIVLNRV